MTSCIKFAFEIGKGMGRNSLSCEQGARIKSSRKMDGLNYMYLLVKLE